MNKKCLFCDKNTPIGRPKYCSYKCVKRAWYVRRNPNAFAGEFFDKSRTGTGFIWEKRAAKLLGAEHLEFNRFGADLKRGDTTFEVKTSTIHRRKNKRGKPVVSAQRGIFSFKGDNRYNPRADFFFCIGIGDDGEVMKYLLIPGDEYPLHGISISPDTSKYDKFIFVP